MTAQAIELIDTPEPRSRSVQALTTPADLLRLAVESGADLDRLERLMALQERYEANEARKAYTASMTAFKAEPITILKRKKVGYETDKGDFVGYSHAELSDVTEAVGPALARHDLSYRWDIKQADGRIHITCIVTHKLGHAESTTMDAAPDNSGKKNAIQSTASAITYMQRYTLLSATGMSTKGMDDDGKSADGGGPITESIFNGLVEELDKTKTDAEAALLWASGSKTLHATGCVPAYDEFKQKVIAHRKLLKAAAMAEGAQS